MKKRKGKTTFQIIIISFFTLILAGALLLMLPISSQERVVTPFSDCLFTATSATCVTGLVVHDTATYWSLFGKCVILTLIQIGGMGVITIGLAIMKATGKKLSLSQLSTMKESISAPQVGGIMHLAGFILKASAIVELAGAALLAPVFCSDFGFFKGIGYSLFHSISAFCNAGFDLLGVREKYSSLTTYGTDVYLNIIIMLLIVVGGIGFLTWGDVITHKHHFSKYSLQSKIVIVTSAVLIVLPAVFLLLRVQRPGLQGEDSQLGLPIRDGQNSGLQYPGSLTDERVGYAYNDHPDADRRFTRFHGGRYENCGVCCAVPGSPHRVQPPHRRPGLPQEDSREHRKKCGSDPVYVSGAVHFGRNNHQQGRGPAAYHLPVRNRLRRRHCRPDFGHNSAVIPALTGDTDVFDVLRESGCADADICGGILQRKLKGQAAAR